MTLAFYLVGSSIVKTSIFGLTNWLHLSTESEVARLTDNSSVHDEFVHYVVGILEENVVRRCDCQGRYQRDTAISKEEGKVHEGGSVQSSGTCVENFVRSVHCAVDFVVDGAGSLNVEH